MFLKHVHAGSSGVRRARKARCPSVLCPVHTSLRELIVAFLHNLILFSGTILPDRPCLLPSWIRFGAPPEGLLSTAYPAPVALNCVSSGLLGWGKTLGHSGTIFLPYTYTHMHMHACSHIHPLMHTHPHACTHSLSAAARQQALLPSFLPPHLLLPLSLHLQQLETMSVTGCGMLLPAPTPLPIPHPPAYACCLFHDPGFSLEPEVLEHRAFLTGFCHSEN